MILGQKLSTVQDSRLALTAASFPQQTIRLPLDRAWPLEELWIGVQVTIGATLIAGAASMLFYSLLNILRRITLEVTDDKGPRNVVNVTGPGLLGLIANEGLSLDACTAHVVQCLNQQLFPGTGRYRIWYRIPFVHPMVTGKLRPKMMLPIHLHAQDPALTLDFAPATEIFTGVANPFTAANVEVVMVRRDWPKEMADAVNAETKGNPIDWFIKSDIQETIYALAASLSNSQQRFALSLPGQYSGLYIHHLKGGAQGTLEDLSGSTTVGTESNWTLESGQVPIRSWRQKQLKAINETSKFYGPSGFPNLNLFTAATPGLVTSGTAVVSATSLMVANSGFGAPLEVGQGIGQPAQVFHDFISDGINDADELGSLLDCNIPQLSGLKMEVVGNVTTPAGAAQSSSVQLVGRRFYGDLRAYQLTEKLKAA
jgi:hypothetical protein